MWDFHKRREQQQEQAVTWLSLSHPRALFLGENNSLALEMRLYSV